MQLPGMAQYEILNMLNGVGCSADTSNKTLLKNTFIVSKMRERILRRICFEIKRDKSNFNVSTIRGLFEGGRRDKYLQ